MIFTERRQFSPNVTGLAVSADNERQNSMRRTELKFDLKTERMQSASAQVL